MVRHSTASPALAKASLLQGVVSEKCAGLRLVRRRRAGRRRVSTWGQAARPWRLAHRGLVARGWHASRRLIQVRHRLVVHVVVRWRRHVVWWRHSLLNHQITKSTKCILLGFGFKAANSSVATGVGHPSVATGVGRPSSDSKGSAASSKQLAVSP